MLQAITDEPQFPADQKTGNQMDRISNIEAWPYIEAWPDIETAGYQSSRISKQGKTCFNIWPDRYKGTAVMLLA